MPRQRDLTDPRLLELPDAGPQLVVGKRAVVTGEEFVEQRDHPPGSPDGEAEPAGRASR